MKTTAICLLVSGMALAALAMRQEQPSAKFSDYKTWTKVTSTRVYMPPLIAIRCAGPASWDADPANPHVPTYFNVYANDTGLPAMRARSQMFAPGSVIVKEKFAGKDAKAPELLTVMVKHAPGYAPKNGDWEYVVTEGDVSISTERSTVLCVSCHASQRNADFVYRSYLP